MPQTNPPIASDAGPHIAGEPHPLDHTGVQPAAQCLGCRTWYPTGVSCRSCVTCDRCGELTAGNHTELTVRGARICDSCLAAFYWQCSQCDGWNRDDAGCGNGCCDPDSCACDDCRDDAGDLVHSNDYRPWPVFHGTGQLFLGPEIEIETPSHRYEDCAQLALDHLGELGYLKQDGSIGCGFEIVTHPMSYQWAIANFPWRMLTDLAAAGCHTSDETGLHVHLSRAGFSSPCHTYRWMKFIYRNEAEVTLLAGRSSEQWAAFTSGDRRSVKEYAKGTRGRDRYRAINTGNATTFELRVFASSLNPQQVRAVLAFAAASVEYTRSLSAHHIVTRGGWQWSSFVAWLHQQPLYQPLTDQLAVLSCAC